MKPQDLHKGDSGAKKKSAGKKRKHEDEANVEGSKKKKKVPSRKFLANNIELGSSLLCFSLLSDRVCKCFKV